MSLKNLINKQRIIIDDHRRGAGEIKNFDNPENDIHIDKETNFPVKGKKQKVRIKIPVNSDRPISVESKRKQIPIPARLESEIRSAFEDTAIRIEFIRDLIMILSNYESSFNSEEKIISILKRLAKHFDLGWDGKTIKEYTDEILKSYTEYFTDDRGRRFFIELDRQKITIAENSGYAKRD
jgi:hypothetical protein